MVKLLWCVYHTMFWELETNSGTAVRVGVMPATARGLSCSRLRRANPRNRKMMFRMHGLRSRSPYGEMEAIQ